jgi:hypothetical protein
MLLGGGILFVGTANSNNMLPEILIGGAPNSGTSFLCYLVSLLGFSPGPEEGLKKADSHCRWGYYEYLPIRRLAWSLLENDKFAIFTPDKPYPRDEELAQQIAAVAERDQVEVFKDNALPLTYKQYSPGAKYIVIDRDPVSCYRSPLKAGKPGYNVSYETFFAGWEQYQWLSAMMGCHVNVLYVRYEYFYDSLEAMTLTICNHLGVNFDTINHGLVYGSFRPRRHV